MRQATFRAAGAIAFTFLMASCAYSQTLNIWPSAAPGSENWTQKERTVDNTPVGTVVDHWIDEFYYWLEAQGFTRPPAR